MKCNKCKQENIDGQLHVCTTWAEDTMYGPMSEKSKRDQDKYLNPNQSIKELVK